MDSLSSSLILLIVALVLLWLAVTDRLSRILDAVEVIRGDATVSTAANAASAVIAPAKGTALHFPSLPPLGGSTQVPAV